MPTLEEELGEFLLSGGFSVRVLSRVETWAMAADWGSVFGGVWGAQGRMRTGYRALDEYAQETGHEFRTIPLAQQQGGPPEMGRRNPSWRAIVCRGKGALPDLSAFANLEFAVSPLDFGWTLVHIHEDHACGGPYFVRREWIDGGHD